MILAFNKPFRVLSQFTPEPGSAADTLAAFGFPPNVYAVGRLDADSEGLLLLSDEKGLNTGLLDPVAGHSRTYVAQVEGLINDEAIARLQSGVEIRLSAGGTALYTTLPCTAMPIEPPIVPPRVPPIRVRRTIPTSWVELTLTEGKNRQVRRMVAAVGFPALRLLRTRIGEFALSDLEVGCWRELDFGERGLLFR